jgi:hypothetical protein
LVEQGQSGFWPVRHAERHGTVYLDHRGSGASSQLLVQVGNVYPVGGLKRSQLARGMPQSQPEVHSKLA